MERRGLDIDGIVQGVGFRPFVHALATRLHLHGFVANRGGRVEVEVEGDPAALDEFERELSASAPTLARIESVVARPLCPRGDADFRIASSREDMAAAVRISPDAATCDACLAELFDPSNRRYRYPFINCTACGPRLTIITGSPYDRERTTMAHFEMCAECRSEYSNPVDRRFHAEPIACAICGPRLQAVDAQGAVVDGDPVDGAVRALASGAVVAVKGLGGFHLACDAGNATAVGELRRRKHRDDKPFAVMAANLEAARALCELSDPEAALLCSTARPIVLLQKRAARPCVIAEGVAPDSARLGLMLPYTPLHHLLIAAAPDRALVMTSGNRSDEPIAIDNDDARTRLTGIADLFLVHDRDIQVRCDDSVLRHTGQSPVMIRRSRGYAPVPVPLGFDCPSPMLAVGGQLKNTFALARGSDAYLSHHVGDLDDLSAFAAFQRDVTLFEGTFDVTPAIAAHDLHPDYASTRLALSRNGVRHIGVQHHHAHIAACMAEHRLDMPVIGIAWDGAGWGLDGCIWGGEFMVGNRHVVERVAHVRYVPLPGGDRAAREPWRMVLSHFQDAGIDPGAALHRIPAAARRAVGQMIERRFNAPQTSSVGRLFDAVAALCGAPDPTTFEGQAAMWLESLAEASHDPGTYPFDLTAPVDSKAPQIIDTRPLIRAVEADRVDGCSPAAIARKFHTTLVDIIEAVVLVLRDRTGLNGVALSGGVFLNGILTAESELRLAGRGFEVYRHRVVPPGDGGLSLGQIAVAAAVLARPEGER